MRTVVGVFPSREEAESVVRDLNKAGVPLDEVVIADSVTADGHEWSQRNLAACAGSSYGWLISWLIPMVAKRGFAAAAWFGAALGAGAGSLLGIVALRVGGGPIVGGSVAATISAAAGIGLAFGAIIAGMYNMGVSHEEVALQQEARREHGVVVAAHVDVPRAAGAFSIMTEHGARCLRADIDAWKASGWSGTYVPDEPYPSDSTLRKHEP